MANSRTRAKKNRSIIKLQFVVEKLQRSLLLGRNLNSDCSDDSTYVPGDVKEGHFAVIAVYGSEVKRLVVALGYLTHPRFLVLLEQAAEMYGFNHEGALTYDSLPSKQAREYIR
ncbi:putative small auxin-up RNA [Rosa chinensis]|uniref:Putative small auxin-up RNA n=1 Tax=Rosa chinensis TaxID=74649 RepID=A0A2P6QGZ7_ROSCH|nr:putative small auxin-up RNA [Rosa chinensis]